MFKQKPRKVEVKKVPENRPLVEAMKVRLEHEMHPQVDVSTPTQLEKLLRLTVEVRGGGVAQPFEATLTEAGARTILDALK